MQTRSWGESFNLRGMRLSSLILFLFTMAAGAGFAQPRSIDTTKSTMTVLVSKAGAFSMMGHDHQISAPIAKGTVDATAGTVELQVDAAAMRVTDPKASDKDRAQVQQTMLGPEVLDTSHYPSIVFKSTAADGANGSWNVRCCGQSACMDCAMRRCAILTLPAQIRRDASARTIGRRHT